MDLPIFLTTWVRVTEKRVTEKRARWIVLIGLSK